MDGGISMVGEICTDDDAEGDAMEVSVNGRRRRRCQNTTFSTQVRLINAGNSDSRSWYSSELD